MTLKDFHPGQRVYAFAGKNKVYGTAGHSYSDRGKEIIVRFDQPIMNCAFVIVSEKNAEHFHAEPLN